MRFLRRVGLGDPVDGWGLISGSRRDSLLLYQEGGREGRWGQVFIHQWKTKGASDRSKAGTLQWGGGTAGWVFRTVEKAGEAFSKVEK